MLASHCHAKLKLTTSYSELHISPTNTRDFLIQLTFSQNVSPFLYQMPSEFKFFHLHFLSNQLSFTNINRILTLTGCLTKTTQQEDSLLVFKHPAIICMCFGVCGR